MGPGVEDGPRVGITAGRVAVGAGEGEVCVGTEIGKGVGVLVGVGVSVEVGVLVGVGASMGLLVGVDIVV